jgi:predicted dehydrogenase
MFENEKGKLDAVVVLTPTPSHTEIVLSALEQGYAVICEKALAASSKDGDLIAETAKKHKAFLAVTFNYSGYPMVREIKRFIDAGKLGTVQQVHVEMPQEGFLRLDAQGHKPKPQPWRLQDYRIPTVSLDLGVHLHHLVYYLTGEKPLQVVADQARFGWFPGIVDNVMCLARYSGDVRCQMWYGKTALGHRNGLRVRVYGDKASAEWYQMHPEEATFNFVDGARLLLDRASTVEVAHLDRYNRFKAGHPAGFLEAFANLYADIADCLRQHAEAGSYQSDCVFGAEHALEGLRLFEAIVESATQNTWVSL